MLTETKKVLVAVCVLLTGFMSCKTNEVASSKEIDSLSEQCFQKDYPRACAVLGEEYRGNSKFKLAIEAFSQGCKLSSGFSCTQAGYLTREYFPSAEAAKFTKRACDLLDGLGCYNVACGLCREKKTEAALDALKYAYALGLDLDEKQVRADPDFACIKTDHREADFEKILVSSRSRGRILNTSLYYDHVPFFGAALTIFRDFSLDLNSYLLRGPGGGTVAVAQSSFPVSEQVRQMDSQEHMEIALGTLEMINTKKISDGRTNGFRDVYYEAEYRFSKRNISNTTLKMYHRFYGGDKFSAIVTGSYPSNLEDESAQRIKKMVENALIDPFYQEKFLKVFTKAPKLIGYEYRGATGGVMNFSKGPFSATKPKTNAVISVFTSMDNLSNLNDFALRTAYLETTFLTPITKLKPQFDPKLTHMGKTLQSSQWLQDTYSFQALGRPGTRVYLVSKFHRKKKIVIVAFSTVSPETSIQNIPTVQDVSNMLTSLELNSETMQEVPGRSGENSPSRKLEKTRGPMQGTG